MDFEKLLEEWAAAFAQVAEESLASLETALTELAEHLAVPLQETLRQWEALWNLEEEVELEPEPEPFEETLNPSGESFTTSRFFVSPIGFGGIPWAWAWAPLTQRRSRRTLPGRGSGNRAARASSPGGKLFSTSSATSSDT